MNRDVLLRGIKRVLDTRDDAGAHEFLESLYEELTSESMPDSHVKVNLGGHGVPKFDLAPFIGINFDLKDPVSCENLLAEAIEFFYQKNPSGDQYLVILPGIPAIAAMAIAIWHGVFGTFPNIQWSVRTDSGFEWPTQATADLHAIRTDARMLR